MALVVFEDCVICQGVVVGCLVSCVGVVLFFFLFVSLVGLLLGGLGRGRFVGYV